MIDLRNSIFESDFNTDVSTIRQNLQTAYVNRLLKIVDTNSKYDNMSKSSAYFNISWLNSNLNTNTGDLQSKQHNEYLLFLLDSFLNK